MTHGKMGFKRWIALGAVVFVSLLLAAAFYWRNDIVQASLDPKQPFQTYSPPPPPDYSKTDSWALIPDHPDRWTNRDLPADVFFVHPTTFDGGNHWNAPIDEARADRLLTRVMLPNYAGPFYRVGRMFAPRYRQASLYSQLTNRDDAREARRFAYGDVRAAFRYYLDHYNFGRPFILVGVEQGGTLVARLLRDEIASQPRRVRQTAGVYMIDTVVPADEFGPAAAVHACSHRDQARCVVAWTSVLDSNPEPGLDRARRASVWNGEQLEDLAPRQPLCVNPLLGSRTDDPAGVKSNLGAANVTGLEWGARPAFLIRQVGAQCVGGLLKVTRPKSPSLVPSGGWTDQLKQPAFSLFYADLEADAQARVASLLNLDDFPKPAPPIERRGDQGRTPAHKVGN